VLFGENGIAAGLAPGKLVVDMSSIAPLPTKTFAARINALGCDYLDAPVSGGEVCARAASLTIMAGGPLHAFERARGLFELMGKNITLVGGNGDGQTTKVANQIIGARALGVSLPNTAACQELFNAAQAAGGGGWDHSGVVRVLEKLANHEIGPAA